MASVILGCLEPLGLSMTVSEVATSWPTAAQNVSDDMPLNAVSQEVRQGREASRWLWFQSTRNSTPVRISVPEINK